MSNVHSPLPTPQFFDEMDQLSTKKSRGTPRRRAPPRPPVKSAPPISRFFHTHRSNKALAVSFQNNSDNSFLSKRYDELSSKTYFSQCFVIVRKIGSGSFGQVYKVQNVEDKKFYAVKKSHDPFRGDYDRLRKLEEVKKHEQLPTHSNCIQFFKAWEEWQHLYIQTELCETSLSNFAEENHDIPEKLIWKYLVDLLLAIKHLHDHNLVHMDIKPDNIFISYDGICKLGDFGLVLDLTKSDRFEAIEGDPKYLAPELLDGHFSKSADIFSLGITLLELACDLELPQGGLAWHELRHGELPPAFTQHLSKDLKNVICQMMTIDYRVRPSVDKILSDKAVNRVLRRRRIELVFKYVLSQIRVAVVFVQFILLWPLRTCFNLVRRENVKKETPKRHSSETEFAFSDDDCLDDDDRMTLHQCSDIFNDSIPNFENRLANSTPVIVRHRNTAVKSENHQRDYGFDVFRGSPTSLCDHSMSGHSLSDDEKNDDVIVPRNLTELFDSIFDDD